MIEPMVSEGFVRWQNVTIWACRPNVRRQRVEIWIGRLYVGFCWGKAASDTRWYRERGYR